MCRHRRCGRLPTTSSGSTGRIAFAWCRVRVRAAGAGAVAQTVPTTTASTVRPLAAARASCVRWADRQGRRPPSSPVRRRRRGASGCGHGLASERDPAAPDARYRGRSGLRHPVQPAMTGNCHADAGGDRDRQVLGTEPPPVHRDAHGDGRQQAERRSDAGLADRCWFRPGGCRYCSAGWLSVLFARVVGGTARLGEKPTPGDAIAPHEANPRRRDRPRIERGPVVRGRFAPGLRAAAQRAAWARHRRARPG